MGRNFSYGHLSNSRGRVPRRSGDDRRVPEPAHVTGEGSIGEGLVAHEAQVAVQHALDVVVLDVSTGRSGEAGEVQGLGTEAVALRRAHDRARHHRQGTAGRDEPRPEGRRAGKERVRKGYSRWTS